MLGQLVFSVTYDCPITCKYCATDSGPHGGPWLDAEFMKGAIDATAALGLLRSVIFTGGEPLLRRREVEDTIRHAASRSLWTRVVSNAFWARTPQAARDVLGGLKDAGLSEINFSCDDLHQEHIPLERISNAFWAARDLQIPTLLAHKKVRNARVTVERLSEVLGLPLVEHVPGGDNPKFDLYSSALTVPVGHDASSLPEDDYVLYPQDDCEWQRPCAAVLNALIVSPTKQVRLCCGIIDQRVPELGLGAWDGSSLAALVCSANADLVANWLALEGPYGMMRFVQRKDPSIAFRSRYVNHCHLCNDVLTRDETREVLHRYGHEKAQELTLRRGLLEALRHPPATVGEVGPTHPRPA